MRRSTALLSVIATLSAQASAQPAAAPSPASFQSILLRGGGVVTVRYGPTRRVTVSLANPDRAIRADGDQLVIERCSRPCRHGHQIEVEVVTPEIGRLAVSDGGLLRLVGRFPRQAAIAASVDNGGTVDMRPLEADIVSADVSQGGRILARPVREMAASISDGGNIIHWGNAEIASSVRRGGAVVRGAQEDLGAPLVGLDPPLPALPRLRQPKPPRPAPNPSDRGS